MISKSTAGILVVLQGLYNCLMFAYKNKSSMLCLKIQLLCCISYLSWKTFRRQYSHLFHHQLNVTNTANILILDIWYT